MNEARRLLRIKPILESTLVTHITNIEALCAALPETLAHSPSQMSLSCLVAPPSQRKLHKDGGCGGGGEARSVRAAWAPKAKSCVASCGASSATPCAVSFTCPSFMCHLRMRFPFTATQGMPRPGELSTTLSPTKVYQVVPAASNRANPRGIYRGPSTTQGLHPGSPPHHRQCGRSSGQPEPSSACGWCCDGGFSEDQSSGGRPHQSAGGGTDFYRASNP